MDITPDDIRKLRKLSAKMKAEFKNWIVWKIYYEEFSTQDPEIAFDNLINFIDELYKRLPADREASMSKTDWNEALERWNSNVKTPAEEETHTGTTTHFITNQPTNLMRGPVDEEID